ncbi:scarecrow-like protein 6 [Phragmites australis]|uniref:scarecrow-like protein 6 n=1 Tax=Phragmites australis TaxID=29695 RepID=UPI002D779C9D|nr:scarecrow-like protein 6 [Phragmites australis]
MGSSSKVSSWFSSSASMEDESSSTPIVLGGRAAGPQRDSSTAWRGDNRAPVSSIHSDGSPWRGEMRGMARRAATARAPAHVASEETTVIDKNSVFIMMTNIATTSSEPRNRGLPQQHLLLAHGKPHQELAAFWDLTSVLDHRPSPPTSASTLSSPLGDVAALAGANAKSVSPPPPAWPAGDDDDAQGKEDWVHHLPPLDMELGAAEAWEPPGVGLPEAVAQPQGLSQDNTFLRWIIGGDDASQAMPGVMDHPVLDLDHIPSSVLSRQPLPFQQALDDTKAAPFGPSIHQPHRHAAFLGALPPFDTALAPPERQHPMAGPAATAGGLVPALKPKAEAASDDPAAEVDQLAEAAKLAEAGDVLGAREILARLNYRLPAAPTAGSPLLRSAFYFKEALRVALSTTADASSAFTPVDVLLKLGAHKAFSEVSPVLQFTHFTCVQAVLDELGGAGCIHVLDFDIGVGEQWASLMQELAQRRPSTALKVTALVSTASYHPLELQLVHENLSNFAAETRVRFQFAFFNLDTMDPTELLAIAGGDAIAVHLPVGSVHAPAVPSILNLVRRLGAKLVISVDRSYHRSELPFAAHLFQAFQSCVFLLESLDAVDTDSNVAGKIERFLIRPRVESCVVKRYHAATAGDKTPPWRTMLASAGFVPVQASSFAEAQADSLLKKVPVRGFRVEKRAGSLVLHWQLGELVSVTAWRC